MRTVAALCAGLCVALAGAGRVPDIPAGHRAQYSLQHADGSFKYGWDTGRGATAQVEGDARNEVRGSYSGGPVSVSYTAGVNGYVPVIGAAPVGAAPPPPALLLPPPPAYGAGAHAGGVKGGWSSGWSTPQVAPGGAHIGPAGPLRPDGSYSFSYSTGDQSRQESADAANNVRGSFSFKAKDDGRTRTVNYHAGAGTGFVAQGQHLPTPPPVPHGAPHGAPQGGSWDSQWAAEPEPEPQPEPAGDATYSFGYQTKDASRLEVSDPQGNVQGSYAYVGPDGVSRRVDYEAGAGKGFVAKGDHLPKDGDVPAHGGLTSSWQTGAGQQAGDDGGWQQTADHGSWQQTADEGNWQQTEDQGSWQQTEDQGSWQQTEDQGNWQQKLQPQPQRPRPAVEPADVKSSRGGDGSYSFSYSTKDQSREEQGDVKGNVKGSFSFVAKDDGKRRRVDYHAGAATGFVAKGDHLPKPQPSEVQPQPTASEPVATTETPILLDDKIDLRLGLDDSQQTVDDSQQTGDGSDGLVPTGEPADVQSSKGSDGSYQFSYSTPDQSREEQADAKNNVKGSFSFVAPDGVNRRVDYEAGAGKGFVAKGDHLPKAEASGAAPAPGGDDQQTQVPWTSDDDIQQQTQGPWNDEQQTQGPDGDHGSGDASYSYAYETDSSRKQESADAQGNVQGSFSYNDGSGSPKTVTYTARAGEGFKAKGDHLPKPGQFLAAAAAAGVGGSVHGGAWGRGRGPGAQRPGVGVKTSAPWPRGPEAQRPSVGVKTSAPWPHGPEAQRPGVGVKTWPQGLRPQVSPAAAADPHGPAGEVRVGDGVVRTYLPPGVPGHKVGYVYEAKS